MVYCFEEIVACCVGESFKMINDDLIWTVIKSGFCSFKARIREQKQTFCRNEYNVTGLCNRVSCPLANSRYATVKEIDGVCYLYMKTIERAHTPNKLWERVKLSKSYVEALKQIDKHMLHWPGHMKHRVKQRLTKIRQYLIRMRKLRSTVRRTLVPVKSRENKVQAIREKKAEATAKIDLVLKKKLIENLKSGTYDSIVNIDPNFAKVLEEEEDLTEEEDEEEGKEDEVELVDEFIAEEDEEEEEEDIEDYGQEFEFEEEEGEKSVQENSSIYKRSRENDENNAPSSKKPRSRRPHVNIVYEHETETTRSTDMEKE